MLSPDVARRVARMRRENPHYPLAHAVRAARFVEHPPALDRYPWLADLDSAPSKVSGEIGPYAVEVTVEYDEDARLGDDDVTGTFTDREVDGAVPNTSSGSWSVDGLKFYVPSTIAADYPADARRLGISRGQVADTVRAWIARDCQADATRTYVVISATVTVAGVEVASSSVGWVDIGGDDTDWTMQRAWVIDTAGEVIAEALGQVSDHLPAAMASARATYAALVDAYGRGEGGDDDG